MAARILVLLPAIALVLAGCTGGDSHGHGEPALLLGIANELSAATNATWTLTAPNGSLLWEGQATIEATKTHEKKLDFEGSGEHTIRVSWTGADAGNGTVTYDPSECEALTHIIVTVAPDGLSETKRECH